MIAQDQEALACLERTRAAVLNVVMGIALGIAVSGLLLRWRDGDALWKVPERVRQGVLSVLFILVIVSHAIRRIGAARSRLRDRSHRFSRFYRVHVISALVASAGIPLGLLYGWLFRPRLDAVSPFWVAALALGLLALPRAAELEDLDDPAPQPGGMPE